MKKILLLLLFGALKFQIVLAQYTSEPAVGEFTSTETSTFNGQDICFDGKDIKFFGFTTIKVKVYSINSNTITIRIYKGNDGAFTSDDEFTIRRHDEQNDCGGIEVTKAIGKAGEYYATASFNVSHDSRFKVYRVYKFNSSNTILTGSAGFTIIAQTTTINAPTLTSPTSNQALSPGNITFSWNKNNASGDATYKFSLKITGGNILYNQNIGDKSSFSYDLTEEGIYQWEITAVGSDGTEVRSGMRALTIKSLECNIPQSISIDANNGNTLNRIEGETLQMYPSTNYVGVSYEWNTPRGTKTTKDISFSNLSLSDAGNYSLTVTDESNSSCYGSGSVYISVAEKAALSVNPTSLNFTSDGGVQTLNVNSNIQYWSIKVTQGTAWLSVNPQSGSNNGQISVTASKNNTLDAKTGILTLSANGVNDITILVSQPGASPNLTVDKANVSIPSSGGNASVIVTSNTDWNYTITSGNWFTVNRIGNSLSISAPANQTTDAKPNGQIKLTGGVLTQSITISQEGRPNTAPEISNMGVNQDVDELSFSFTVTDNEHDKMSKMTAYVSKVGENYANKMSYNVTPLSEGTKSFTINTTENSDFFLTNDNYEFKIECIDEFGAKAFVGNSGTNNENNYTFWYQRPSHGGGQENIPPQQPTNLIVSYENGLVNLEWNAVKNVNYYEIYKDNISFYKSYNSIYPDKVKFTHIQNNSTRSCYQVFAVNINGGKSVPSNIACISENIDIHPPEEITYYPVTIRLIDKNTEDRITGAKLLFENNQEFEVDDKGEYTRYYKSGEYGSFSIIKNNYSFSPTEFSFSIEKPLYFEAEGFNNENVNSNSKDLKLLSYSIPDNILIGEEVPIVVEIQNQAIYNWSGYLLVILKGGNFGSDAHIGECYINSLGYKNKIILKLNIKAINRTGLFDLSLISMEVNKEKDFTNTPFVSLLSDNKDYPLPTSVEIGSESDNSFSTIDERLKELNDLLKKHEKILKVYGHLIDPALCELDKNLCGKNNMYLNLSKGVSDISTGVEYLQRITSILSLIQVASNRTTDPIERHFLISKEILSIASWTVASEFTVPLKIMKMYLDVPVKAKQTLDSISRKYFEALPSISLNYAIVQIKVKKNDKWSSFEYFDKEEFIKYLKVELGWRKKGYSGDILNWTELDKYDTIQNYKDEKAVYCNLSDLELAHKGGDFEYYFRITWRVADNIDGKYMLLPVSEDFMKMNWGFEFMKDITIYFTANTDNEQYIPELIQWRKP